MNRRDFLKITGIFVASATVPLPPALAKTVDVATALEFGGSRFSAIACNSALDTVRGMVRYLALLDPGGEIVGIAPIGEIAPAAQGMLNLSAINIEVHQACEISSFALLDEAERVLVRSDIVIAGGPHVWPGQSVSDIHLIGDYGA